MLESALIPSGKDSVVASTVQEAVTNAFKRASPEWIRIAMLGRPEAVFLRVTDSGVSSAIDKKTVSTSLPLGRV